MLLTAGSRLGPYEIVAPLGAGGMGEVYRARDPRLGRDVAIKVLPQGLASHPERLARLEREARTVAALNHPNIVTLFSFEEAEDIRFFTMELVEGRRLDERLVPGGLPVGEALDHLIALTEALAAAHAKGIVHRDLKPANVMLDRAGRLKVLDFGLAKSTGPEARAGGAAGITRDRSISMTGAIAGTVPYMAPEQLRGETVDARTDLFALGIIAYELLCGCRPFAGATSADVSSAILRDPPEALEARRSELPDGLDHIVERCLAKSARDRFQTALEVGNELRSVRRALERGAPKAARRAPTAPGLSSIAVLPFVNMSGDEANEYFSDGLAEELLNVLAKIPGLRVAARTSSFQFKQKGEDPAGIGRQLNVTTLLTGSVRKAGERVRISVQLVKAADGFHLWSDAYDRTLEDIFAVQDEIARAVVKELRATLLGAHWDTEASGQANADVAAAVKGRGGNPEAHRLYIQGRHFLGRMTREDARKGIGYLREALVLDPGYALVWAELGRALCMEADMDPGARDAAYARGREAAERALALEPDLAEGHGTLGWIRFIHDRDWVGARASIDRALELAPANARVLRWAGTLARALGHLGEAERLQRRALEQDPLGSPIYFNLAVTLHAAERLEEAEAAARKAVELAPEAVALRARLALILLSRGRIDEAFAEALREPSEPHRLWALSMIHRAAGRTEESDQALLQLAADHGGAVPFKIAESYAARGDADAAFAWLGRAYDQWDVGLNETGTDRYFRSLHGDPRWRPFLEKLGCGELPGERTVPPSGIR